MPDSNSIRSFIENSRKAALSSAKGVSEPKSEQLPPSLNSSISNLKDDSSLEIRVIKLETAVATILNLLRPDSGKYAINIINESRSDGGVNSSIQDARQTTNNIIINKFREELDRAHQLIQQSKNEDALQQFESFKGELLSNNPKPGTLRGLWTVITEAVPAVKDALEIGILLSGL